MPLADLSGNFTFESFLEQLKVHHNETNEEIRILAYITDLDPKALFDSMKRFGFETLSRGSVIEVKVPVTTTSGDGYPFSNKLMNSYVCYYCHYNYKKNLLLCFTSETLEIASKTMDKFVDQKSRVSPLWIHPLTFNTLYRQIIAKNPNTIISEFHASRYHIYGEEVIRESFDRYFRYIGDDGRYTLDDISKSYGVLPTSIQFFIPNSSKFRITNMGKFTFTHGDIDLLFEIINDILSRVLETKSIIDKAKIEFIPINMGKKEVTLPNLIPLDIVFSREIDYVEMEKLLDNMGGEDFNFEIFDMLLAPGSICLSGTILDRNKNIAFNITANLEKITLSPRKDTYFDSMLQFYKLITERLDLNARINLPDQIVR
jgi:hypothetical protein